jgi:hypothetical protein
MPQHISAQTVRQAKWTGQSQETNEIFNHGEHGERTRKKMFNRAARATLPAAKF